MIARRESGLRWGVDTWVLIAYPVEVAAEMIQGAGFGSLEYCYEHFVDGNDNRTIGERVRALADLSSTLSIEPSQMHAPYGELDRELASSNEGTRAKGIETAKEWLHRAVTLGVRVLVFHTALDLAEVVSSTEEYVNHSKSVNRDVFTAIGRMGGDLGVRVAIENRLERIFGSRPKDLLEIVSADPDNLGVCLDTGHANFNHLDCGSFVEELGSRLWATHIHDNDRRSDQHLIPYMGSVDWNGFFRALERVQYKGAAILEIPGDKADERLCANRLELVGEMFSEGRAQGTSGPNP